jgi:glycosyltransferase involved in cell wall biosynthesis
MNGTALTVVIPCYRGEHLVSDAIHSVLAQAGERVEIIVVDDGSPDRSAQVVAAIGDARVHLLRHEMNRGIAGARNTGLAEARGEFVAFLDQDDIWLSGFVEAGLAALREASAEKCVLGFCAAIERNGKGQDRRMRVMLPLDNELRAPRSLLAAMLRARFVVLGASIIRRAVLVEIGGFDEKIRGGSDDFDVLVRLAERGGFVHIEGAHFVRRLHGQNYTNAELMIDESLAVIDRTVVRHPELAADGRMGKAQRLYRRASDAIVQGRTSRARADYAESLRLYKWQPRAWLGLALSSSGGLGTALAARWYRNRMG